MTNIRKKGQGQEQGQRKPQISGRFRRPFDTNNYSLDYGPPAHFWPQAFGSTLALAASVISVFLSLLLLRSCNSLGPLCLRPLTQQCPWSNGKWCENMQTACALAKTVSTSRLPVPEHYLRSLAFKQHSRKAEVSPRASPHCPISPGLVCQTLLLWLN